MDNLITKSMKIQFKILWVLAALLIGFFVGRQTVTTKEKVRYIKGETVTERIEVPYPVKEYVPSKPELIYKDKIVYRDTGSIVIREVDSLAILNDYIKGREYAFNVFDNQNGKLDVNQVIQYNRLQSFDYSFTPIHREITRYKEKAFTPFVSGSYNTFDVLGVGGGLFIRNFGIEYNYLYQFPTNQVGHEVGVKWKF